MRIVSLGGKRSNYNFFGFGDVMYPETVQVLPPEHIKYYEDERLSFHRHDISLRAALRQIRKKNYRKGTVVRLYNWYVGYADLLIYI